MDPALIYRSRMGFGPVLEGFGPFFRLFWDFRMDPNISGIPILAIFGVWPFLAIFWPFLSIFGHFLAIFDHFWGFRGFWGVLDPFWGFLDPFWGFEGYSFYSSIFWGVEKGLSGVRIRGFLY